MPAVDDNYPLPGAYTSAEVTGVDDDVGKHKEACKMTIMDLGKHKETHKQMTIMAWLKPILRNPVEHPISYDMGQIVTIYMEHYAEPLKNKLAQDESPELEDQTLKATDKHITGEGQAAYQFLSLKLVLAQKHCS